MIIKTLQPFRSSIITSKIIQLKKEISENKLSWIALASICALVAFFDFFSTVPLNDDWAYSWSVQNFVSGHNFQLMPTLSAWALPQIGIGILATLPHYDLHVLRLTVIPFIALTAIGTFLSSRLLGASKKWSYIAAIVSISSPVFLSVSVGYMSDIYFLGFIAISLSFAIRWLKFNQGFKYFWIFGLLSLAQRQMGFLLFIALLIGVIAQERKFLNKKFFLCVTAIFSGVLVSFLISYFLASESANTRITSFFIPGGPLLFRGLLAILTWIGFTALPFFLVLWRKKIFTASTNKTFTLFIFIFSTVLFFLGASHILQGGSLIGGEELNTGGLGPLQLEGNKPLLFPLFLFQFLELLSLLCVFIYVLKYKTLLWIQKNDGSVVTIVSFSVLLFLLLSNTGFLDRYVLVILIILIPLFAKAAGKINISRGIAFSIMIPLLLNIFIFIIGEQDYLSWQTARDQAARQAYLLFPPSQVSAGQESNALYYAIPYLEKYHIIPPEYLDYRQYRANYGPELPKLCIEFGKIDSKLPGVTYNSLAPGKIVLIPSDGKIHYDQFRKAATGCH